MLHLVTHHTASLLLYVMSNYAHDIPDVRLLYEVERCETKTGKEKVNSSMAAITDHKTEKYSKGQQMSVMGRRAKNKSQSI